MRTPDLFDLSGRTALVTGGGRGIGRHISVGLAEAGAHVFVVSRKLESCEAVAEELRSRGLAATAMRADVSKPEQVEALVEGVVASAGGLDVVVNNAGRVWAAPALEYPLEGWDRVFDLNVRGLWVVCQHAARHMAKHGGGSIVNVSSISAFRGAPDHEQPVVAYNASKGAVISLSIDLAVKLAPHGIRVNCIAPGPFLTDMMNQIRHDADRLSRYEATIPLNRSGGEGDIKGVAVFLASDASAFVTGQTLAVDGGLSCVTPPQPT